jgi:hypothetical protein
MQRIIYIGISYIRQNALKHLSALYMQHGFESLFYKCIFFIAEQRRNLSQGGYLLWKPMV